MKLWGKVASGIMYVIAAIFLIVAVVVPEARRESIAVAAISIAVALFGIPALVKVFSSFTGDEDILTNGVLGSATITSLEPTGWRYNRQYPIVKFNLNVDAGGAAYQVEIKQAVDPELLERLASGVVVVVRVDRQDHKRVVIDWREPSRGGTQPAKDASAQSTELRAKNSLWPFLRWGFLIFGLIFFRLSCEEGAFKKGGVTTQAVVLQKTYTRETQSTSGSRSTPSRRSVSYKFTTRDGRTVEGRYDVLPQTWEKLKEGEPVVIEYLPDSPSTSRIPDQRASFGIWRIMALVLLVSSTVLFIMGWRQKRARAK